MAITGADRQTLADELNNDPLNLNYGTLGDAEAADKLNALDTGQPGSFIYSRALNELHQNHRQAFIDTVSAL